MIVLSAGMQKSGSGCYYNLINDLLVSAGFHDCRFVRDKFRLHDVLKDYNCNLGEFTLRKLFRILIPHMRRYTFTVKTHQAPPVKLLRVICRMRILKATYIFRDPRDVVVSAFEHGQRIRRAGQMHSFAALHSIESSIEFVAGLLGIWNEWHTLGEQLNAFVITEKYENLLADSGGAANRLVRFLDLALEPESIHKIIEKYSKISAAKNPKGLHFNKGVIGRFRSVLSKEQLGLCERHFSPYLERMGYCTENPT
jgi:hypothetical protein